MYINIDNLVRVGLKLNELSNEYISNYLEIECLKRKIRVIKANKLKNRFLYTAALFSLSFLAGCVTSICLEIPVNPIQVTSILVTSVALENIKFHVMGYKKQLREFSSAKTEEEKNQELSMYEYRKQELLERNKTIDEMFKSDNFDINELKENDNEKVFPVKENKPPVEDYMVVDGKAVRQYDDIDFVEKQDEVIQEHNHQKVKVKKNFR